MNAGFRIGFTVTAAAMLVPFMGGVHLAIHGATTALKIAGVVLSIFSMYAYFAAFDCYNGSKDFSSFIKNLPSYIFPFLSNESELPDYGSF